MQKVEVQDKRRVVEGPPPAFEHEIAINGGRIGLSALDVGQLCGDHLPKVELHIGHPGNPVLLVGKVPQAAFR